MSAVIVPFPRTARHAAARVDAVRDSIIERARSTKATSEQKFKALQVARIAMNRGESAGWALQLAYAELPTVRQPVYRWPTSPTGPEAA